MSNRSRRRFVRHRASLVMPAGGRWGIGREPISDPSSNETTACASRPAGWQSGTGAGRHPMPVLAIAPYLSAGCGRRVTVTYGKPVGTEVGVDHTGGLPTATAPSPGSCRSTSSTATGRGQQITVTGHASAAAVGRTA
ncbi:hypothetical protein ACFCZY_35030 [Streptomyces sp. NPDC056237]|uniref:hypothetical protein n=1 Tax=unclassified Streptomyces TaxID=2593676 RepID=UPI0035E3170F